MVVRAWRRAGGCGVREEDELMAEASRFDRRGSELGVETVGVLTEDLENEGVESSVAGRFRFSSSSAPYLE